MKKILLTAVASLALSVAAFAGPLRIVSATPDPFRTGLTVCFETPSAGKATVKIICAADGKEKDKRDLDLQGHGTHCAGLTVAPSNPDGQYIVEVSFEGDVVRTEVTKSTP